MLHITEIGELTAWYPASNSADLQINFLCLFEKISYFKYDIWHRKWGRTNYIMFLTIMVYSQSDLAGMVIFYLRFISLYLNGSVLRIFLS